MAEGRTNRAIAQELVISEHTVEKHVTSVMAKLRISLDPAEPVTNGARP